MTTIDIYIMSYRRYILYVLLIIDTMLYID